MSRNETNVHDGEGICAMERLGELKAFDRSPLDQRTERTRPLLLKGRELQAQGNVEKATILYWEWMVLDDRGILEKYRLQPIPDRDQPRIPAHIELRANPEALAYFQMQAEACENPVHVALYLNFVWEALEQQHDTAAHLWARRAIQPLLEAAAVYAEVNWGIECVGCLARSLELGVKLNDAKSVGTWLARQSEIISSLCRTQQIRWRIETMELIRWLRHTRLGRIVSDESLTKLATTAQAYGRSLAGNEETWHLALGYVQEAREIYRELGEARNAELQDLAQCEMHERRIEWALARPKPLGGPLPASLEAAEALAAYQDVYSRLTEKDLREKAHVTINALKLRIRKLNQEASAEFDRITVSEPIDIEQTLGPFVQELFATNHALWMDRLRELFPPPSVQDTVQEAQSLQRGLYDWVRVRISEGDRSLGFFEPDEFKSSRLYSLSVQLSIWALSYVMWESRRVGVDLVPYIRRDIAGKLPERSDVISFLDAAARYIDCSDYTASVHLLAPLCERLFKAMVERAGVAVLAGQQQMKQEESSLGGLLDDASSPDVCRLLTPDLRHFLRYAWVDEPGANLRNRVAHGWLTVSECNRSTVTLLLWTVILTLGIGDSVQTVAEGDRRA